MKRLFLCLFVLVIAFSMLVIVLTVAASPVQEHQIQEGPFQEPDTAPENAASPQVSASDVYSNVYLVDQLGGTARAVAISGTYAYVGLGPRLMVLDVSEPATPTVRGRTEPFPNGIRDVAVAGDHAYVTNMSTGLRVVDISDPANPVEVGFYDTPGWAWGVAVAGDYAYVADWIAGLRVVDISDPSIPIEVGSFATPGYAVDVSVVGDYVYVADGEAGLRVVDVSEPTSPTEVGFHDTPGYAQGVAVAGDYAYVANFVDGLRIVDVSDPANPAEVGFEEILGFATDVSVVGNIAYVANSFGLRVVDVSDPTNPVVDGIHDTPGTAGGVAVAGDNAYVADGHYGLRVIDVSDPTLPAEIGSYDPLGYARAVAVAGDYAYVADSAHGLLVVDVDYPATLVEVGSYDTPGSAMAVAVAEDYAYVADWNGGLRVVDISDPSIPIEVGSYDTPGYARGVAVAGDHAYVTDEEHGLRIVDVSNPITPTEAGFYDTPGAASGVVVSGDYAYVADEEYGLRVVDVSNSSVPTETGFYDTPGSAWAVAVAGDYAYVADGGHGMRVVDVSDPTTPVEVGFYDTHGNARDVAVAGNMAYLADGIAGLRVVDVTDPANPTEVGYFDTSELAYGVAVAGGYIYVADLSGGIYVLATWPIEADFEASPLIGIAPLTVTFANHSWGSIDTCAWDFGDGITSTVCNDPSHMYGAAGVYSVSLTVSGTEGLDTKTMTNYITVYEPAVADFIGEPTSGLEDLDVDFTNLSTGDFDSCAWDFGDGDASDDCQDPSHEYEHEGTYTVTLTISGLGGTDTLTRSNYITVYEEADARFKAEPTEGLVPLEVNFENRSDGDFDTCAWDFGDGETSDSCLDPSHTYTKTGTFTVELTVSGLGGTDTKTREEYIDVYEPATANFSGTPTSGIAPLEVEFTNLSTGDFDDCEWDFGDGEDSERCQDPSHEYEHAGTYTVTLTVSGLGSTDTKIRSGYITVYEPVDADFRAEPTSGVVPLEVAFENQSSGDYDTCAWDFGDGDTSDSCLGPTHTYTQTGTYTVALTVSGLGGTDTDAESDYIAVYEPATAIFSGTPTSGVAPLQVDFGNQSTGDFDTCAWGFGDGNTSENCLDPSHTYTQTGTFTVTLTVSGLGSTDTLTRSSYITVYEPVDADFSATPTSGLVPLAVGFTNLSTGNFDTCSWDFGDGDTSDSCLDPSHTYTQTGTYTVALTVSGLGGTDTDAESDYIAVYEPTTAVFSGTPTSGPAPLEVDFSNQSTGGFDSCAWDFGDGNMSDSCLDPSHTYTQTGTFTVALTVSGLGSTDTLTRSNFITVYEPAVADFIGEPTSGIEKLEVDFTNRSTGNFEACLWDFGDGATSDSCLNPSHEYDDDGTFTVSLTVSGLGGTDTLTRTDYITVYEEVEASFRAEPTSGIAPLEVSFENRSHGEYSTCAWDFGDGSTSDVCLDPTHTYTQTGTFTVELTVSGLGGTDTKTREEYIDVYEPAVADFSGTPTSGIAPLEVDFTNLSTGNYDDCDWDFGDGGTSQSCLDPSHSYDQAGTYTVTLTITGLGGTDTITRASYITVYEPAVADFSATPTSGVEPLEVDFTNLSTGAFDSCAWDFGDGATSDSCLNPSHEYDDDGTFTVSLTVSGSGGTDTLTRTDYITVYEPAEARFRAVPTSGVIPLEVAFENRSDGDYEACAWDFGDGNTSDSCLDLSHTYIKTGTFTVELTVSGLGGTDTKTQENYIAVYEPTAADFSGTPTNGVAPLDVDFTIQSSGDYDSCQWDFGDGGTSDSCQGPSHRYGQAGTYTVSLTITGLGGTDTATRANYITVYEPVNADFSGAPTSGVAPLEVNFSNLSSGDFDSCDWDFGDGGTSDNCLDPAHTFSQAGTFTVSLTVDGLGGHDVYTWPNYITVYEPAEASLSASPTSGSAPLTVFFTNLSSGDYTSCQWDHGDGAVFDGCQDMWHTYTVPGTYTVTLTVEGPGGTDTVEMPNYVTVGSYQLFLPVMLKP